MPPDRTATMRTLAPVCGASIIRRYPGNRHERIVAVEDEITRSGALHAGGVAGPHRRVPQGDPADRCTGCPGETGAMQKIADGLVIGSAAHGCLLARG